MFKFVNKSKSGDKFLNLGQKLYTSIKQELGFDRDPVVTLVDDDENMKNSLGKTAYYDPSSMSIVLYCSGRHIKDILRSFSHELVHHNQNCSGNLSGQTETPDGYAQNDDFLREMEKEAYLKGNMQFRDWEDGYKMKDGSTISEARKIDAEYERLQDRVVVSLYGHDAGVMTKLAIAIQEAYDERLSLAIEKRELTTKIRKNKKRWLGLREQARNNIIDLFNSAESAMTLVVQCAGSAMTLSKITEKSKDRVISKTGEIIDTDFEKVVEALRMQFEDNIAFSRAISEQIKAHSSFADDDETKRGHERRLGYTLDNPPPSKASPPPLPVSAKKATPPPLPVKEFSSPESEHEQDSLKDDLDRLTSNQVNIDRLVDRLKENFADGYEMNESTNIISKKEKKMKEIKAKRPIDGDDIETVRHKRSYSARKVSERLGWKNPNLNESNCGAMEEEEEEDDAIEEGNPNLGLWDSGIDEQEEEVPQEVPPERQAYLDSLRAGKPLPPKERKEDEWPEKGEHPWKYPDPDTYTTSLYEGLPEDQPEAKPTSKVAKIKSNKEWNEYIVKFYKDGKYLENADYHCDDKQEAIDSKTSWENS
jgi:hypothetical protein